MVLLIRLFLAVIVIAYPFVVYFGLIHFQFWQVTLFIAVIALIRLAFYSRNNSGMMKTGIVGAFLLLLFSLLAMLLKQQLWLKIYPVAISLTLLYFFAASLQTPKSMIERFAELKEKNISEQKKNYMRKLTLIWCGFFILNALIATYTIFTSSKTWMLYNGLISYVMIGLLITIELLYRHLVVLKKLS